MPFVTEEIWQKLNEIREQLPKRENTKATNAPYLMMAPMPSVSKEVDASAEASVQAMTLLMTVVSSVRALKSENSVPPSKRVSLFIRTDNQASQQTLEKLWRHVAVLSRLEKNCLPKDVFIAKSDPLPSDGPVASTAIDDLELVIPLGDLIDVEKERGRLKRDIDKAESEIKKLDSKLNNASFVEKAPQAVVEEQRQRLDKVRRERNALKAFHQRLLG